MTRQPLRCLWIARELPFPLESGDRIYSANLARSLAQAGSEVHFIGLESDSAGLLPSDWGITWHAVLGKRRRYSLAIFSRYPLAAAAHATRAYRTMLRDLFSEQWDAVIFDHFGSGWALQQFNRVTTRSPSRPITVHISHNYESALARALVRNGSHGVLRRIAVWQNFVKITAMEKLLARSVDLITTITTIDADAYRARFRSRSLLTLTPGYSGPIRAVRTIDRSCPRRVILVGSFRWVVKQENLRQLLGVADPAFDIAGITLDVVGVVPDELLLELRSKVRATRFHGFVDDLQAMFNNARIALVPEVIGGGFKLKFLDYVFSRVPVASLRQAMAGLPLPMMSSIISAKDIKGLVDEVVRAVDNDDQLNLMQSTGYDTASTLFDWADRGSALLGAIHDACADRSSVTAALKDRVGSMPR